MTFAASTSPDISEALPFLLSAATETQRLANEQGVAFDCTIGGVGFRFAVSDTRPYKRQTLRPEKDQFDSSREAGEQTLSQYWIRSQTSWHMGAGITNYEPGSDETTQNRFTDSLGVDVWTQGEATLLRKTAKTYASAGVAYATGAVVAGADVLFTNTGGVVRRSGTPFSGTTAALTPVAVAGSKILVGTATTIMSGTASGSTLADLWTGAPVAPRPYWVKDRIIASAGASLFELTMAGGVWPGTSIYTHPDSSWVWTAVADAPSAILAAGKSNGVSAIYRFSLEDAAAGTTPQLSQAFLTTEFPPGEEVLALRTYLGRYVGIGTTKGLRIGILTDQGQLEYGPLLVDKPVTALTASDRFLYGAVTAAQPDGKSGAVRVDLSLQIGKELRFPYAWDARTGTTGAATSIAMLGVSDRVAIGVASEGVYVQSATDLEASGWLESGRIRYSTVEPKSFQLLDLTARVPAGSITVEALEVADDDAFFLGKLTTAVPSGMGIAISRPGGTFEYLTFRYTLESAGTNGPTLESYQIKALPTPRRQRMIQIPLLCLDEEEDRHGTPYGHEGYGWERVSALEELEEFDGVVQVQDNRSDETFRALIEQVTFTMQTPDDPNVSKQGFVELLLRKL